MDLRTQATEEMAGWLAQGGRRWYAKVAAVVSRRPECFAEHLDFGELCDGTTDTPPLRMHLADYGELWRRFFPAPIEHRLIAREVWGATH